MGEKVEIAKPPRTQRHSGRWFWECTESVAALGFERSIPLGSDTVIAFEKAKAWNKRVELARAGLGEDGEPAQNVKRLIAVYKQTDEYKSRKKSTKDQYNSVLGQIGEMAGPILVTAIKR
jgi:hypothetical protein